MAGKDDPGTARVGSGGAVKPKLTDRIYSALAARLKQFLPGPGGVGYIGTGSTGERRDLPALEAAYEVSPWLHSGAKAISDTLGAIPIRVYRELGRGEKGVEREEVFNHPLVDLLWNPGRRVSATDLKRGAAADLSLAGEFFLFVHNGTNGESLLPGKAQAFQPLRPRFVNKVITSGMGDITGYEYLQNGQPKTWDTEFIVHGKTFNPRDDTRGLSPVKVARSPVMLGYYMSRYAEVFFKNDATPSGLLSAKGRLDDAARKINLNAWNKAHGGVENAHKVAHVDGETTYQQIGVTNKDAEFLGLQRLSKEMILAILMVPPIAVGDLEDASYANARQQMKLFYELNLIPKMTLITDALNTQFIPVWFTPNVPENKGLYVEADFSHVEVLQADKVQQAQVHQIQINTGLRTVNEIRRDDLNLEEVDWGNDPPSPFGGFGGLLSGKKPDRKKSGAPPNTKVVNVGDVFDFDSEDKAMRDAVLPILTDLINQAGSGALTEIGSGIAFNLHDPRVEALIAQKIFNLGHKATDVTKRKLQSLLVDAASQDMTVDQTAAAIRDMFDDFSRVRSITIARTEVNGANNGAAVEGYLQSGVVSMKEWMTAGGNVRPSHAEMEGQRVGLDEPFISGDGNLLRYPGDGMAPPGDTVNCCCTVLPVIDEGKARRPSPWQHVDILTAIAPTSEARAAAANAQREKGELIFAKVMQAFFLDQGKRIAEAVR